MQDLAPHHPYVLKLLMNLYEQVRDWPQLINLLPDLKKYKVVSPQGFQKLEENAYLQSMIDLEKQNQIEAVTELYAKRPKTLANNHDIIAEYIKFLIKTQNYSQAETILRSSLRKEFDPKLIELYGLLPCTEQQLMFTESLLKKNPHSETLYICLGIQSIAQHLWGKAKHYLEKSIELTPTPIAYCELGKLYERLNDPFLARDCYKKGLELATKHIQGSTDSNLSLNSAVDS